MPDADHVKSAIRFFNYVTPTYEKQLANAILARMKEYGLTFDDIGVGKDNRFSKYIPEKYLAHHGILGQKWGVRRYQNEDGSLTNAGRRHLARLQRQEERRDIRWVKRNQNKIYNAAYRNSKKELKAYDRELSKYVPQKLKNGKISKTFAAYHNVKMAELMNKSIGDIPAPSGKLVRFVAKRGEMGVHVALADPGYDMSNVKRGVYGSGRVAYKKNQLSKVQI